MKKVDRLKYSPWAHRALYRNTGAPETVKVLQFYTTDPYHYRESLVCRFNRTVSATEATRSDPVLIA